MLAVRTPILHRAAISDLRPTQISVALSIGQSLDQHVR